MSQDIEQFDVVVLGAGIVGSSVAAHLTQRQHSVAIVELHEPGEAASFGNAGLIESSAVFPPSFPRSLPVLLRIALNKAHGVRHDPAFLPRLVPWLFRYWRESAPEKLAQAARTMWPMIAASLREHEWLAGKAGAADLIRRGGWIEVFHHRAAFERAAEAAAALHADFGVAFRALDPTALMSAEPALAGSGLAGGVQWTGAGSVSDPGALTKAYADLAMAGGAWFFKGDARTLERGRDGWCVSSVERRIRARRAVIALGAWSNDVLRRFAGPVPLVVKRGYHQVFPAQNGATLSRPIVDEHHGFVLSPMHDGLRLTTGVEFAHRDARAHPRLMRMARRHAGALVSLREPLRERPWLGNRPCLPDMRPVIGPVPGQPGLFCAFGHGHLGLTLGAVTGRMVAEAICDGDDAGMDLHAYRPERFW